jgi:hypothetical protein
MEQDTLQSFLSTSWFHELLRGCGVLLSTQSNETKSCLKVLPTGNKIIPFLLYSRLFKSLYQIYIYFVLFFIVKRAIRGRSMLFRIYIFNINEAMFVFMLFCLFICDFHYFVFVLNNLD